MKSPKPNRYGKNQVGGTRFDWTGAGIFGAALTVFGLLLVFVYLNTAAIESQTEQSAQLSKEVSWLKTRVANLEGYTAHLEAQIEGLDVFDCVFTGDQADTNRANYERAIDEAFERIAKGRAVSHD